MLNKLAILSVVSAVLALCACAAACSKPAPAPPPSGPTYVAPSK